VNLLPATFAAALTKYDERRDPIDHFVDKVLPANPGLLHAVARSRTKKAPPEHDFLHPTMYRDALCGITVKVVLTSDFNPGDEGACQSCAAAVYELGKAVVL
jgi:hypothetical protein